MKHVLAAAILATSLAACGGGGGGGSVTPPTGGGTKPSIALHGGFEQTKTGNARHDARHVMDVNLTTLPTQIEFDVPDSYIVGNPNGITGDFLIAYLTTSDGSMNGIPATLPSITVSQSGPTLTIASNIPAPTPTPSVPPISLGGASFGAATQPGVTTLTISTSVNGQALSTSVSATTYSGFCVASDLDNTSYNCPKNGLYWDASGVEHVAASTAQADVYIQDNGDGTTSVVFPYGATEIKGVFLSSLTSVPAIPSTSLTVPGLQFWADSIQGEAYVFNSHNGAKIKSLVGSTTAGCVSDGSGGCVQTDGLNTGDLGMFYARYLATTTSTFTF